MTDTLLNENLTVDNVRIAVQYVWDSQFTESDVLSQAYTRTPKPAKSLVEVYLLIKKVLDHYQTRESKPVPYRVILTEEEPDEKISGELITFSLVKKLPGAFSQGAPGEGKIRNQKMMFRESLVDKENPGYRKATCGKWFDNVIRLTCWARTNKEANARAEWLTNLLEEYMWYFKASGVDRFLFQEQHTDITINVNGNKWYGRPIDYFVRTETIYTFSEKQIEEILIQLKSDVALG